MELITFIGHASQIRTRKGLLATYRMDRRLWAVIFLKPVIALEYNMQTPDECVQRTFTELCHRSADLRFLVLRRRVAVGPHLAALRAARERHLGCNCRFMGCG